MATRPWVTPAEVRAYTEIESVQERSDERLAVDITRAEQYVIAYTHNIFKDDDPIPNEVKTAVIILAEAYAHNSYLVSSGGEMKSETFDDYSYTKNEGTTIDIEDLGLGMLLDPFIRTQASGNVFFRMRKL